MNAPFQYFKLKDKLPDIKNALRLYISSCNFSIQPQTPEGYQKQENKMRGLAIGTVHYAAFIHAIKCAQQHSWLPTSSTNIYCSHEGAKAIWTPSLKGPCMHKWKCGLWRASASKTTETILWQNFCTETVLHKSFQIYGKSKSTMYRYCQPSLDLHITDEYTGIPWWAQTNPFRPTRTSRVIAQPNLMIMY